MKSVLVQCRLGSLCLVVVIIGRERYKVSMPLSLVLLINGKWYRKKAKVISDFGVLRKECARKCVCVYVRAQREDV